MTVDDIIKIELERVKALQITVAIDTNFVYCLIPEYDEVTILEIREKHDKETYKDYEVHALNELFAHCKNKGYLNLPVTVTLAVSSNIKTYNSLQRYAQKQYQTLLKRDWYNAEELSLLNEYLVCFKIRFSLENYLSVKRIEKIIKSHKKKNRYVHKNYKWFICIETPLNQELVEIKIFSSITKTYIQKETIKSSIRKAKLINLFNLYNYLEQFDYKNDEVLISTTSSSLYNTLKKLTVNEQTNKIKNIYERYLNKKDEYTYTQGIVLELLEKQRQKKYNIRMGDFPKFLQQHKGD